MGSKHAAPDRRNKMNNFNAAAFEAWMNKNNIKWYHMSAKEQANAIKEFKAATAK